jgi:hypothetical protein
VAGRREAEQQQLSERRVPDELMPVGMRRVSGPGPPGGPEVVGVAIADVGAVAGRPRRREIGAPMEGVGAVATTVPAGPALDTSSA